MMSGEDIEVNKSVFSQKKLTEIYIGYFPFDWVCSIVKYEAECTISEPFDLFDKTIVGILTVEPCLSIEKIGEILGLNIIQDTENNKYRDEAEYEILEIALSSLKGYGMIETGDIHYSSCKLTDIGREYAIKGRKFRIEAEKEFVLFYDHTSGDHQTAKQRLANLPGKGDKLIGEFDFLQETLMRELACVQATEIYDPEKGNSFRYPLIKEEESVTKKIRLNIALLFDLETSQIRLLACEPVSHSIIDEMSKWIEQHEKASIINDFFALNTTTFPLASLPDSYVAGLVKAQKEMEELIKQAPEDALTLARQVHGQSAYIDWSFFWAYFDYFLGQDSEEVWCILPEYDNTILDIIEKISNQQRPLFLVFVGTDDISLMERLVEMEKRSRRPESMLFVMAVEEQETFEFYAAGSPAKRYSLREFNLASKGLSYALPMLFINESEFSTNQFKNEFVDTYIDDIEREVESRFKRYQDSIVIKEKVLSFERTDNKLQVLKNPEMPPNKKARIDMIQSRKQECLAALKAKHKSVLREELDLCKKEFESQEFQSLEAIKPFQNWIVEIKGKLFEDYKDLHDQVGKLNETIDNEVLRIKDEILAKTYVIDTNVFIDDPEIISRIDKKNHVVLSHTVINELDGLKKGPCKEQATKAIQVLNKTIGRNKQLRTAKANTEILPEEYRQKSPDNKILSVAYLYKDKNVFLLTSDNGLQLKAKSIGLPVISFREFIGMDKAQEANRKKLWQHCVEVFKSMPRKRFGKQSIGDFMKALNDTDPGFDYRKMGFEKASDFLASVPHFQIIDDNFIRLKNK